MGQYFLYANLRAQEYFEPSAFGTDSKFMCNAPNDPGILFQLLTVVGLQASGGAEVPTSPVTSISNKKYQEMLAECAVHAANAIHSARHNGLRTNSLRD